MWVPNQVTGPTYPLSHAVYKYCLCGKYVVKYTVSMVFQKHVLISNFDKKSIMKKIIITGSVLISLLTSSVFAQTGKPFMAFELKTMRTKHKDASGQMTDWDKDQKVKNMEFTLYIKSESGVNEIKVMNTKTSKVGNIIGFDDSDKGAENNVAFITLKGGKDITDKNCSVKIMHPDENGGLKHARWIKVDVINDDEIIEYDAKYIQ
jgi:hypothetical protein